MSLYFLCLFAENLFDENSLSADRVGTTFCKHEYKKDHDSMNRQQQRLKQLAIAISIIRKTVKDTFVFLEFLRKNN